MDGNDHSNITMCPVMHAKAGVRSNSDWWPNQLNVKILYQNSSKSDPMSKDFNYSDEFKKQVKQLNVSQPDRIILINNQCDKLSLYLDSNRQENLNSLDFKPLTNSRVKGSTHECDAWSDQDAQRLDLLQKCFVV